MGGSYRRGLVSVNVFVDNRVAAECGWGPPLKLERPGHVS